MTETKMLPIESYVVGSGVVPGTSFSLRGMNKPKEAAKRRGKFPFSQTQIDDLIAQLQAAKLTLA